MTNLFSLSIPFVGRIFAQRDTVTTPRLSAERLHSASGGELLLCCGWLRVYLTPASSLASERR